MGLSCRDEKQLGEGLVQGNGAIGEVQRLEAMVDYRFYGDIWTPTWAADGKLILGFGDGTGVRDRLPTLLLGETDEMDAAYLPAGEGRFKLKPEVARADPDLAEVFDPNRAYRLAQYTPSGLVALAGKPPRYRDCPGDDQCLLQRHVPRGDLSIHDTQDKPSGLLAVGSWLLGHFHYPPGDPTTGYLAVSLDGGKTWKRLKGHQWHRPSPFTVMMWIQMGQAYRLNRDGYLYALGIPREVSLDPPHAQDVFLARLRYPRGKADGNDIVKKLERARWEYYAGTSPGGIPQWSNEWQQAKPLPETIHTMAQGGAVYHPILDRYYFFSGLARWRESNGEAEPMGMLFESPYPWGPWREVGEFPGGFIGAILPQVEDTDRLFFTAAGGGGVPYTLNIGTLQLKRRPTWNLPCRYVVASTHKREQVIGDIDFETMKPTRLRTASRFGIAHTDLGASFEHRGKLWFLFGDSDPEAPGWDERHDDAIAYSTSRSVDGWDLQFLMDDRRPRGYHNLVIRSSREGSDDAVDLGALNVPLTGISDGRSMFVWFTAGGAARSLVARSDDDGRTFDKVYDLGSTHFVDMAAARWRGVLPGRDEREREWVLMFGSGNRKHRDVYLAATPLKELQAGNRKAVRFLSGRRWTWQEGKWKVELRWSSREEDSVPLFTIEHGKGPGVMSEVPHGWGFGEPLIHYNRAMGCWVATYNSARRTIRLRTSAAPWGPWSDSIVLFDPAVDYGRGPAYGRFIGDDKTERLGGQGELYGPYVIERFTRALPDGRVKLYWLLSPWQPYTVVLMESTLEPVAPPAGRP